MKSVKKKFFSVIISSFMVCNLFSGITTYANDSLDNRQNTNVSMVSSIKDPEESVRILVQLDGEAAVDKTSNENETKDIEEYIKKSQEDIIKKVQDITGNKVRKKYSYLVNGFSIEGKRKDIAEIQKIHGVKSAEESVKMQSKMQTSNTLTEAESVWNNCSYKGEGMVIAVIDTGFDYTHKDFQTIDEENVKITKDLADNDIKNLGYGKYFSEKIPYGYNYVDGNDEIKNEDQIHGMHVAGIALANGEIKGVAPEAQLLAMRVADKNGEFYNEDIIQAIEDAVKLGADVINMSFGTDGEYYGSNDLLKKTIEKAIGKGVICVNACGNAQTSVSSDASSNSIQNLLDLKDTSAVDITSLDSFSVASMDNLTNNNYDRDDFFPFSNNAGSNSKNENMSSFSSWGPSPDLELKPEITAPGGNIKSTVYNDSYETESGTSMASPNVAGGCALILQSLKHKNIDYSQDINKVDIIKCLMMNTAKVLTNSSTGVIYSPRQQGAGLMQLEKAVNNNVIVTDDRKKPYIALKNIHSNSVSFEMTLTNYGKEDVSYTLKDENLYTEVCENNISMEKEISGAKISFNENNIKVKAGETLTVTGTLSLLDNFQKQNFVEGFISFKSSDEKNPDLSIPILGFYGDYGDETIVDAPIYDDNSLLGITGLGQLSDDGNTFNYYGSTEKNDYDFSYGMNNEKYNSKVKFNSDNVAFSPNNDNVKDDVQLMTYFLRNAREYKVEVLDKNKNLVGNTRKFNDRTKNLYSYYIQYSLAGLFNEGYSWNGTYYDESTGNNKVVDDGQYYIRITTNGYTENAKNQVIDLPVKVDTKTPEVQIEDVSLSRRGFGGNVCTIKWKANDDFSGMSNEAYANINGDSSYMVKLNNINENNGEYSAMVQLNRNLNVKNLSLTVSDNAGNKKTVSNDSNIKVEDDNTAPEITIISRYAEGSVNYTASNQINFTVTGKDESEVTCIAKNETAGVSATSEMNSKGQANVSLALTNGANLISVRLKDFYGNISETEYFTVVYVENSSSISAGFTNVNGTVGISSENTINDVYKLEGYVTQKPKKLKINNEEVAVNDDLTFNYNLKLNQGLNKVTLSVEDNDGNVITENTARLYYDNIAPTINLDKSIDISENNTINTDKDSIVVSGNVCDNSTEYYVFINDEQVLSSDSNKMRIIDVADSNLLNRQFSKEISLNEGINVITLDAVDLYGNKTERKIKVFRKSLSISDNKDINNNTNKDDTDISKGDDSKTDNTKDDDKKQDNDSNKKDNNNSNIDNNQNNNKQDDGQGNKTYDNSLIIVLLVFFIGSFVICRKTNKIIK